MWATRPQKAGNTNDAAIAAVGVKRYGSDVRNKPTFAKPGQTWATRPVITNNATQALLWHVVGFSQLIANSSGFPIHRWQERV